MKISLTPYEACSLVAFLDEFKEDFEGRPDCEAIRNVIKVFSDQVYANLSDKDIDEALAENAVNKLIGRAPSNSKSDIG